MIALKKRQIVRNKLEIRFRTIETCVCHRLTLCLYREITHDPIYSYSLKEKMDILAAAEEEERMRNGQNDEDFFENCKRFTVSSRDSLVDYFNKKRETINENMQNVFRMDLEALQGLLRCDQRRSKEISSDDTDVETNQQADEAPMATEVSLRDSGSLDLELLRRRTRLRLLREYRPR